MNWRRSVSFTVAGMLFAVLGLMVDATAQVKRKPRPLATPPARILSGDDIISRAGEYVETPVENQLTLVPSGRAEDNNKGTEADTIQQLQERIRRLESGRKVDPDEKHKRMLLNLDVITRAEQRSESLRKQLFDMIEKENSLRERLEKIDFEMRPEMIERTLQMMGSLRPEEVRDARRRSLLAERSNLESLLNEIQVTKANLSSSLQKSEQLVDKLRLRLEKEIDDSLADDKPDSIDPEF